MTNAIEVLVGVAYTLLAVKYILPVVKFTAERPKSPTKVHTRSLKRIPYGRSQDLRRGDMHRHMRRCFWTRPLGHAWERIPNTSILSRYQWKCRACGGRRRDSDH